MSESDYVLTIFKRYWKILLKWIFHVHGLPEITSDELYYRINSEHPPLMIDIRSAEDFNGARASVYGHIPNAMSIDILELDTKLEDLESFKDKEIVTMCSGGGLSLAAVEILTEAGFKDVKSLKGGTDLWHKKGYPTTRNFTPDTQIHNPLPNLEINIPKKSIPQNTIKIHKTLDAKGLSCPMPILKSRIAIKKLEINQVLEILTSDPGSLKDIPRWAHSTGQDLLEIEERGTEDYRFLVRRLK